MRILIEGERYPIEVLKELFVSNQYYDSYGLEGIIKNVGYYHNMENNQLIFMLPKVFMKENGMTVFGIPVNDLLYVEDNTSIIVSEKLAWVRNLTIYFYKSLVKFRQRCPNSTLINYSTVYQLRGIQKTYQYSYLDILLSFINYYKKNKHQVLYKHIEAVHNNPKKPKWEKTVRKGNPILVDNSFIYDRIRTKNKRVNEDEQLIVYFFSILNYFNSQHDLGLHIDKIYPILKGKQFEEFKKRGLTKLKKIKYRYYTDALKEMHSLCMLFLSAHDQGKGKSQEDFITANSYDIIFEDMVDHLFSDNLTTSSNHDISLHDLKYHPDGKILDHIFEHRSLLDDSNIFYIGDSKYYKVGSEAGYTSHFKQFTYAKNVIQYNIDLLNENDQINDLTHRYRDELTEGYNITPNFFIYGAIVNPYDYKENGLKPNGGVKNSYHFRYRLFDRDTLFVHQYKINFLFVLKAYVTFNETAVNEFRRSTRELFRNEFIKYFSEQGTSGYTFYKYVKDEYIEDFVNSNFKKLNGKIYKTNDGTLLLAKHELDSSLQNEQLLDNFTLITLE